MRHLMILSVLLTGTMALKYFNIERDKRNAEQSV